MPKGTITIPKDLEACKNGTCGHPHEMPIEFPDAPAISSAAKVTMETPMQTPAPIQHVHEMPKEDPHETLSKNMPKGVNFGKCANGNCGIKVKNAKGITTKYKKCTNCGANTVPKSSDFCPTCGKDSDEFDESEINIESEEE